MFNLVGLALTFSLCPLPLTFHRISAVHLTEAPTQAPLGAVTPAKNSRWHWDSFHLAPCILPPGVVLRSETRRCHIRQLPLVTPEQDLGSWAGRSRLLTCPTLELTTPTPSPSSTQPVRNQLQDASVPPGGAKSPWKPWCSGKYLHLLLKHAVRYCEILQKEDHYNSKIIIQPLFFIPLIYATLLQNILSYGVLFSMVLRKETVHFSRKTPLGEGCKKERQGVDLKALWTELEGLGNGVRPLILPSPPGPS